MKVYTVEVEVNILADSAQEAFEVVAMTVEIGPGVLSVNGICAPYCIDGDDE